MIKFTKSQVFSAVVSVISAVMLIAALTVLVRLSYSDPPPTTKFLRYDPPTQVGGVTFDGFTPVVILFLAANYVVVALFGYALTVNFFSGVKVSSLVKLISSFFIGYTCIIGVIRIFSMMLPYRFIYWPVLAVILLMSAFFLYRAKFSWKGWALSTARSHKGIIVTLLFAAIYLSFILILQIYQGGMLWVGHGPHQYSTLLQAYRVNNIAHFPIITQHYEELIFHYFLTMPLELNFAPILSWWTTLALTKLSIFLFIYTAFRKVEASLWMSSVFALFMMLGTTSLVIERSYVIIDAGNPISYIVHPGRIVQIGFAILLILDAVLHSQRGSTLSKTFFLLSAVGLAATSISNILWIMPLYMLTVAYTSFYNSEELIKGYRVGGKMICYGATAVTLLLYSLPFHGVNVFVPRALAVLVIVYIFLHKDMRQIFASIPRLGTTYSANIKSFWSRAYILVGSGCVSLLLLGNVFVNNSVARSFIRFIGKLFGNTSIEATTKYVNRGVESLSLGNFTASGAMYRTGLSQFAASFAGVLALILLAAYLFERGRRTGRLRMGPDPANTVYEVLVMLAASIPFVFFITDFVNIHSYGWLLTRFLEIPVYLTVFIFLYAVNRFCSRPLKVIVSLILIAYVVVPFIYNHRIDQLTANWGVFLRLLNGTS